MKTAAELSRFLSAAGVRHALIGATALAFHGVSRSTRGIDFLVTDQRVLNQEFWTRLDPALGHVEIRKGDCDDPLAGVVRIRGGDSTAIDVVVGKFGWQSRLLERSDTLAVGNSAIAVVSAADLVLLKIFAGGAQDRWDIVSLLGVSDDPTLTERIDELVPELPGDARALWDELRSRYARDLSGS